MSPHLSKYHIVGNLLSWLRWLLHLQVEQLVNIPEPVLRGLLKKFEKDEEQDIMRLKGK